MGPELILFPIAYYGSAVVGGGLLIGIIARKSRRSALIIFALAILAALWGAMTGLPHWETVTAGINFTLTGLGLSILMALWKLSSWLWRKAREGGRVVAHG